MAAAFSTKGPGAGAHDEQWPTPVGADWDSPAGGWEQYQLVWMTIPNALAMFEILTWNERNQRCRPSVTLPTQVPIWSNRSRKSCRERRDGLGVDRGRDRAAAVPLADRRDAGGVLVQEPGANRSHARLRSRTG